MDMVTLAASKEYTRKTAQGMGALVGPPGPQGPIGPAGPKGDKGDKGDPGSTGATGEIGAQGPRGEAGPQGPRGEIGPPGADGPQGAQGIQGPKGDFGDPFLIQKVYDTTADMNTGYASDGLPEGALVGINNATGGEDGGNIYIKGETAYEFFFDLGNVDGISGPQGPQGEQGPTGQQGEPGEIGPKGEKGEKGDTGPQGAPGQGVPPGGASGQVLMKASGEDYDTKWANGGSSGSTYLVKAPVGTIVIWSGTADNIPTGWALCDGQDGRPDLRDKFVLGAGENHTVGETGGSETVTLTNNQIPSHSHQYIGSTTGITAVRNAAGEVHGSSPNRTNTDNAGGGEPHNNMPPYYALCYIIKVTADETDGPTYTAGDGVEITKTEEGQEIGLTTPVQGIVTQAEFNALTEAQRSKGFYVIPDSGGGSGGGDGGSSEEVYSTEETRIGTWIDGKPLYRRVLSCTTPANANTEEVANPEDLSGIYLVSLYGTCSGLVINSYFGSSPHYIFVRLNNSINKLTSVVNPAAYGGLQFFVVIEYTKTADEGGAT